MPQYYLTFADDATSTLATGITAASPSLQLVSGGGTLFPTLTAAQGFIGTLIKNGNPAIKEVVLVTGHTSGSDNLTGLVRNYSGTGALTWNAGDTFALLQPAEAMATFAQLINLQSQFTNFGTDTGSANAYRVILPLGINGSSLSMPIRWQAAHTNTGASTFTDGITVAPLLTMQGGTLQPGIIIAGLTYETIFNGSFFELLGVPSLPFAQLVGSIGNSQVPFTAIAQWESALSLGFFQLFGTFAQSQVPAGLNLPGVPTAATAGIGTSNTQISTTAFANPATLASVPGYFKTPGGILVQYGTANPAGGSTTVSLPVSYTAAGNYLAFGISIASGPVQTWIDPSGKTASSFVLHNSGGSSYWWAIGV